MTTELVIGICALVGLMVAFCAFFFLVFKAHRDHWRRMEQIRRDGAYYRDVQ